ncbi:hypothetical protein BCR34DRAFT_597863 [Clohesyomyces aquaticus]|uniref:Uncharacterized protein n=1 Tax=Clohesyomyces aquaticus TaxID=1231657 RepID=A0A1Y2A1E1_9PLEO|nr:hypothetical protein BCR34DRAFT_597863 [Clohesyomyces aquaticus]
MRAVNALLITAALPCVIARRMTGLNNGLHNCPGVFFTNNAEPDGACCVAGLCLSSFYRRVLAYYVDAAQLCNYHQSDLRLLVQYCCASSFSASGTQYRTTIKPEGGGMTAGPNATTGSGSVSAGSATPAPSASAEKTGAASARALGKDLMLAGVGVVVAAGFGGAAVRL